MTGTSRLDYWQRRSARIRREILDLLGGVCQRCGFDDPRALQVDHVLGGGGRESRRLGKSRLEERIRQNPGDYQVLCANCNWIKRAELGEHRGYVSHVDPAERTLPLFDDTPTTSA